MFVTKESAVARNLDPAQAIELSLLVDIEACWENMRKIPGGVDSEVGTTMRRLHGRQNAYEAFRAKLAAYNSRHTPLHVPELLLNNPSRLGIWCRKMRDLYLQLEHDTQAHCPEHLLEKAYRMADRIGVRLNREPIRRATPPSTIRDAIRELEKVGRWCDDPADVAHDD
jgi:hypothetical protein